MNFCLLKKAIDVLTHSCKLVGFFTYMDIIIDVITVRGSYDSIVSALSISFFVFSR